jgi:hypothetical protein
MSGFSLGDYVTVNERLKAALERFPELRVVEDAPKFVEAPDGKTFIEVSMTVYRSPEDPLPMRGFIHEEYPGTTPYTKASEQANASTSCLGRILGFMGFGIGKSIASADDVQRREHSKPFTLQKPKIVPTVYPDGSPVPDPFTGKQQESKEYAPGDATKAQMGKIRALGKGFGVATTKGLCERIAPVIGRSITSLDQLTKREAGQVIESWLPPVIPDPAGEIPTPLDEEPF